MGRGILLELHWIHGLLLARRCGLLLRQVLGLFLGFGLFRRRNFCFFRRAVGGGLGGGIIDTGYAGPDLNLIPLLGKKGNNPGDLGQSLLGDFVRLQLIDWLVDLDVGTLRDLPARKNAGADRLAEGGNLDFNWHDKRGLGGFLVHLVAQGLGDELGLFLFMEGKGPGRGTGGGRSSDVLGLATQAFLQKGS